MNRVLPYAEGEPCGACVYNGLTYCTLGTKACKACNAEGFTGRRRAFCPTFAPPEIHDLLKLAVPFGVSQFERGTDPFHRSAMPDSFKSQIPAGNPKPNDGWFVIDWSGNQIGFISDEGIRQLKVPKMISIKPEVL